jgi:LuxR family maltose regulon positive regulatory protein
VREFLLETSALERLSGELCDTVTGRPGSQALLEQVEREGLFLVPLDEVRGWWRYHHLFADLLRARLQAEQPGRVLALHRNAAAWYAEHGLADDAIRHAMAAGEMTWAARLIEEYFDEVFYLRGEGATFHRWLSALPAGLVQSRPRLLVAQAFLASHGGRGATVEPLLDAAEHAYASAAEEPFEPTVGRAASMLVNVPALIALSGAYLAQFRGDAEATAAFASRPWPRAARVSGCWSPSSSGTWPWPSGSVVGSRKPSAPSCPPSPCGGRPTWSTRPKFVRTVRGATVPAPRAPRGPSDFRLPRLCPGLRRRGAASSRGYTV